MGLRYQSYQLRSALSEIVSLVLYGGAVWSITSKANIRRVFRLQKRAARVILDVKTARFRFQILLIDTIYRHIYYRTLLQKNSLIKNKENIIIVPASPSPTSHVLCPSPQVPVPLLVTATKTSTFVLSFREK